MMSYMGFIVKVTRGNHAINEWLFKSCMLKLNYFRIALNPMKSAGEGLNKSCKIRPTSFLICNRTLVSMTTLSHKL